MRSYYRRRPQDTIVCNLQNSENTIVKYNRMQVACDRMHAAYERMQPAHNRVLLFVQCDRTQAVLLPMPSA